MILNSTDKQIHRLREMLTAGMREATSLQAAAQVWANLVYAHFEESLVLVRCYVTVPARELPKNYRKFGDKLAAEMGKELNPSTPVLCLLGSRGEVSAWNDPANSEGHLAIPLIDAATVSSIPMVARLLRDLGLGLEWLDQDDTEFTVRTLGRTAGLFYVPDARTYLDEQGRHVVVARDFVDEYQVRTVFGMGGAYLTGSIVCCILFCKERLKREGVQQFLPLITSFKGETVGHALAKRVFRK